MLSKFLSLLSPFPPKKLIASSLLSCSIFILVLFVLLNVWVYYGLLCNIMTCHKIEQKNLKRHFAFRPMKTGSAKVVAYFVQK